MGSHSSDEEMEVCSWRGLRLLSNPAGTLRLRIGLTRATFPAELPVCLLLLPQFMAVSTTRLTSWLFICQPKVEVERKQSLKCIYLRRSTAFSSRKGMEAWRGKGSQESGGRVSPGTWGSNSCQEYSTTHALITHVRENAKRAPQRSGQQKAPFPRNPAP